MVTFQNTVTIARPTNEVFAFLADFGNIGRACGARGGGVVRVRLGSGAGAR